MTVVPALIVNENPLFELSSCERGGGDAKNLSELPFPSVILQNTFSVGYLKKQTVLYNHLAPFFSLPALDNEDQSDGPR